MKILIIGVSRSGTSSLRKAIMKQGYQSIGEPFNRGFNKTHKYPLEILKNDKVCIKTLCGQTALNWKGTSLEFQLKLSKDFDKIILLDRKNIIEHKESYLHMMWRVDNKQPVMLKWRPSDIPEEYKKDFESDGRYEDFKKQKEEIKLISEKLNIPITYYEELYSSDRMYSFEIINKWGLDDIEPFDLNDELDPIYKLKQNIKKNELI